MKVAIELQPCYGNRSGIGTYVYELAKRLHNKNGLEFRGNLFNFLGCNDNSKIFEELAMPVQESRLLPYSVYRRIWNLVRIPYQCLFSGEADLTVFFNYVVPPNVAGQVMTAIYDLTWLRFPETMEKRNLERLQESMSYSLDRSNHILTISQFSKSEIVNLLGVSEDRVSVVYCAPSLTRETEDFTLCAKKFQLKKPYLLYVGTIEPRKNLVRLIRAYSTLKREQGLSHQLVLAGGRGWKSEAIHKEAEKSDGVVFTGYLSEKEKNTLYQNAAAFIFPSLYEGFGIPPLEAAAFGCPTICSRAASLPEVMGTASCFVNPLDEIDIAEGIWKTLSDQGYSSRLIAEGYLQAKKYDWNASADKLSKICATILKKV